jgi:hypothetical protein
MHIRGAGDEGAPVRPGRLEVWYDTVTDPVSGTGFWLHHELVSPTDRSGPYAHGWAAAFPPGEPPILQRFGPGVPALESRFACGDVLSNRGRREGSAGPARWSLTHTQTSAPLYPFGRPAWDHHLLPAAQYLPFPTERFTGTIAFGDRMWELRDAPGGAARIRGHGNAARWGWLHADLGEGDVLEIVAAVGHRPGIDRLRPLPALRLRVRGADWPRFPLLAAPRFKADLGLPEWTVRGRVGARRLRVRVTQPKAASVSVDYRDPDGASATCVNSEVADAEVVLERRNGGRWSTERQWSLQATAHAEIGTRP